MKGSNGFFLFSHLLLILTFQSCCLSLFFQACNVSKIYNVPAFSWGDFVLKDGDAWISFDRDDTDGTSQQKSKRVSLHADLSKATAVSTDVCPTFLLVLEEWSHQGH